jgi:hypothetical protein
LVKIHSENREGLKINITGMLLGKKVNKQPSNLALKKITEMTSRTQVTKLARDRPASNSEEQSLVRRNIDDDEDDIQIVLLEPAVFV